MSSFLYFDRCVHQKWCFLGFKELSREPSRSPLFISFCEISHLKITKKSNPPFGDFCGAKLSGGWSDLQTAIVWFVWVAKVVGKPSATSDVHDPSLWMTLWCPKKFHPKKRPSGDEKRDSWDIHHKEMHMCALYNGTCMIYDHTCV